jgi:spore maturation protein CgeB
VSSPSQKQNSTLGRQSILYIGSDTGTSRHRVQALRRLGHETCIIDPSTFLSRNLLLRAWNWKTGGLLLENYLRRCILSHIRPKNFSLVYIDGGELIGPSLVRQLKSRFPVVINYNLDDPYGKRDGRRFRLYLRSVSLYDLIVVVRDENIQEAAELGARNVLRVHRSADEIAHLPRMISETDRKKWSSKVMFVGTWMPERGGFMARLIELGVPLSIYGDRWQKAPEWPIVKAAWRGPGLHLDDDYARAIQCAQVSLGLLSKGNRDRTTQRSFEIPFLGGMLCAERTPEHCQLYKEDQEAVFWSTPEECAAKCMQLLGDEPRRKRITLNGRGRCLQNNTTNEAVMGQILNRALESEEIGKAKKRVANAGL